MPSGTWANGWVTADVVTAAEFRKGVGAIYDTTLAPLTSASVDIIGIVGGYAHLLLEVYARGDAAAVSTALILRLNNVATADYDQQRLFASGATVAASDAVGASAFTIGYIPAATAAANLFGNCEARILHYAQTANLKHVTSFGGLKWGTAAGSQQIEIMSGGWRTAAAAVNRLTLFPAAGSFVAGTRVTLYGMGA